MSHFAIHGFARLACRLPNEHPLQFLVWYRLFSLHFACTGSTTHGTVRCFGNRILFSYEAVYMD